MKFTIFIAVAVVAMALGVRPGACQEFPFDKQLMLSAEKPAGAEREFSLKVSKGGWASGTFWCNHFGGGKAVVQGKRLSITWQNSMQTLIACGSETDRAVGRIMRVLLDCAWKLDNATLILSSPEGELRFIVSLR